MSKRKTPYRRIERLKRPSRPPALRPDAYALARQCVETGAAYGWHRAHKHTDTPTPEAILSEIAAGIMLELAEWFRWE